MPCDEVRIFYRATFAGFKRSLCHLGLEVATNGLKFRGVFAPFSGCQLWNAFEHEAQDILAWARGRQMETNLGLHFDDPHGDLDRAQPQCVELSNGEA